MLGVTYWCYLSMLNLKSVFKQKDSYVLTMSNFRDLANLPPEFHVPSLPNQNFEDENIDFWLSMCSTQ